MTIRTAISILAVGCCVGQLRAAEYSFLPERFSSIALVTTTGKASIKVGTYDKQKDADDTIFESPLSPAPPPPGCIAAYVTPAGTLLTLTQLPKKIVNDPNRGINSGDWKLTITGKGPEFDRLKAEMPKVTFGKTKPLVYLGTRDQ